MHTIKRCASDVREGDVIVRRHEDGSVAHTVTAAGPFRLAPWADGSRRGHGLIPSLDSSSIYVHDGDTTVEVQVG